ncbi:Metallo-dependent phosphatase [Cytidiella melzeri]|nr:Metallo-dependent phosphatase [Cytidiella melzeri]
MSIYASPDDPRLSRSALPLYQTNEPQRQPGPRASTPERIRERQVKSVPPPYAHTPRDEDFYVADRVQGGTKPNPELVKDHFLHEGKLTEEQALFILKEVTELMRREPNMLVLSGPITVCGDIHGQYYDLMKAFEIGGQFSETNYLFLGDYVDRGCFGIECLLYLYTLKLWYPAQLALLRGNHECRHLTGFFTFRRECTHKYSMAVYDACVKSFEALPVTALIDGKFFCVHGGISPELNYLTDIDKLNRFTEPASSGLLCDLLWADPIPDYGNERPSVDNPQGIPMMPPLFSPNGVRGCSYNFTYEAVCQFLARNSLLGMFRGHEVQDYGYTMHRPTATKKFPSIITVFSAPNYLDVYHNKGAVIKYKNKNITIRQFNASSHPYWLPNFMDAFTWSLPFVGSKITEMLLAVLAVCSEEELEGTGSVDDDDDTRTIASTQSEVEQRRKEIKSKIMAVGKMQRIFQLLREEAENATELVTLDTSPDTPPGAWPGGFNPGGQDALGVHVNAVRRNIRSFSDARSADIANERLPTFVQPGELPHVPAPSMRLPRLASEDGQHEVPKLENLIRQALEEEGLSDGGVVERLAEKIARGGSSRPKALKRFETA